MAENIQKTIIYQNWDLWHENIPSGNTGFIWLLQVYYRLSKVQL
jgi:hypothetical protein